MIQLSWVDVDRLAYIVAENVMKALPALGQPYKYIALYGVPRGGIYAAQAVQGWLRQVIEWNKNIIKKIDYNTKVLLCDSHHQATAIIDDIIDSGATRDFYRVRAPQTPFFALTEKTTEWCQFPWEASSENPEVGPEENIRRVLSFIGEDPNREGLKDTPSRVVKSYRELFAGYKQDPKEVMKVFEDGACEEMVILKDIEFVSCCEHHMLPVIGKAHVGYLPQGKIIGLSKLARIVDIFARRLQVQERMGQQVTKALDENLAPKGSACVIEALHLCVSCRGVGKQNSRMITSSLTGAFKDDPKTRSEFMQLIKG